MTAAKTTRPGQSEDKRGHAYAAIDLGSNSFHMVVARHVDGNTTVLDRAREMVRLGSGLHRKNRLAAAAEARALACLERFGERLRGMQPDNVRIVGTNALRKAKNAAGFIERAEAAAGFPIDIIAGVEEARLIYLGVAETLREDRGRRLVVDIGGGSTELIAGSATTPQRLESLYMGCVSLSERFFADGKITAPRMRRAIVAAGTELAPHAAHFKQMQWPDVIGTSGTARAVARAARERGYGDGGVTAAALERLLADVVAAGHADSLGFAGLDERRRPVFAGGLAALAAVFRGLRLDAMRVSDGALREGVLLELIGRHQKHDTRADTVRALIKRHHIDHAHARRVCDLAGRLCGQVQADWGLTRRDKLLLQWAAQLHEIGLLLAHSQHHKHGAYMLEHMDLAGFSRQEQSALSMLVRLHRRKFAVELLERFPPGRAALLKKLAVLLRLAVLFHRARGEHTLPDIKIAVKKDGVALAVNSDWLAGRALTLADLEQEQAWLKAGGVRLRLENR